MVYVKKVAVNNIEALLTFSQVQGRLKEVHGGEL